MQEGLRLDAELRIIDFGGMRGEGGMASALTSGPEGSVICAGQLGLYQLANGSETPVAMPQATDSLSGALGEPFFGGDGVTASANGDIYADTSTLANPTPNAIVELLASGAALMIWKSWS